MQRSLIHNAWKRRVRSRHPSREHVERKSRPRIVRTWNCTQVEDDAKREKGIAGSWVTMPSTDAVPGSQCDVYGKRRFVSVGRSKREVERSMCAIQQSLLPSFLPFGSPLYPFLFYQFFLRFLFISLLLPSPLSSSHFSVYPRLSFLRPSCFASEREIWSSQSFITCDI